MRSFHHVWAVLIALILGNISAAPCFAQNRGAVTNLPIPRFVSMKASEANVRRGPSLTHRIDWVYKHRNMPLEIIGEFGHWRRVRDMDGAGGWVHFTLLSGVRTVIITKDLTELLSTPKPNALPEAQLKTGVIARLQNCNEGWCELSAAGHKGWTSKANFWGVGAHEIRE